MVKNRNQSERTFELLQSKIYRTPRRSQANISVITVFCDASKYAYAATVYLHQQTSGMCINNLIFLKARLAPNQEISIPRLELLAALIGVRCIKFVERELKLTK